MVGRGGGKKTINRSIPPGRLQSCIQNRGKQLTNQPNIGGVNNNNNLAIEDEIANMVCRSKHNYKLKLLFELTSYCCCLLICLRLV
ncbi:unnamed protein product [Amaranthus hypochondriacus]